MFEIILATVIIEEVLCAVWLCERERGLIQVMTERMVNFTKAMESSKDVERA